MDNSGAFRLIMQAGPQPGKAFPLEVDLVTIGREPSNTVVINDPEISRQHTRLRWQGDGYVVEDLGSTNGTTVNGTRIPGPSVLSNGDVVGLGATVLLVYEFVEGPGAATMVAGGPMFEGLPEPVEPAPVAFQPDLPPPPAPEPMAPPPPPFPVEPAPAEAPLPFAEEPELPPMPPPPPVVGRTVRQEPPPAMAPPPPPVARRTVRQEPPPAMAPPPPVEAITAPRRPPTVATPMAPPAYEEPPEEGKPKSRRGLLIGCGILLLILACALVIAAGKLLWDAPVEFWQDPIGNFDRLFGVLLPLLLPF